MAKAIKVKGLRLINLVNSQGFLIPVQYTAERMDGGLEVGKTYDITITEAAK